MTLLNEAKQENVEEKRLNGLVSRMTPCNMKDGALKADQSYSIFLPIGVYCTFSNFPSNM